MSGRTARSSSARRTGSSLAPVRPARRSRAPGWSTGCAPLRAPSKRSGSTPRPTSRRSAGGAGASGGADLADAEQVLIGGAFGKYINGEEAVRTGLLPVLPWDRFQFLGNTSL